MNKEEYVANMRAMVKKYVVREEDSVTNPPTKRVPMPRAKRGDLVAVKFQDCTRQLTVDLAFFMNTWGYKGTDPEVERHFSDEDIILNISVGIDYQEDTKLMSLDEQARAFIDNGTKVTYGKTIVPEEECSACLNKLSKCRC